MSTNAQTEPRDEYFCARNGTEAVRTDVAARIDQAHEVLAEELGISKVAALRVLEWHERRIEEEHRATLARTLLRVVSELIKPQKNLQIVIYGLAFSTGLAVAKNGARSMAMMADRLGVHRASLSHWKRHWDQIFSEYGRVYGKSPEQCERMRAARLRVLARRNHTDPTTNPTHSCTNNSP